MLTRERLLEVLRYEPETGHFYWRVFRTTKAKADARAGSVTRYGYERITVDFVTYQAHRLAWLYMTGEWPPLIDHRDGCKTNNAWSNLRLATGSQNRANSCGRKNRKLDLPKGVTRYLRSKKYCAQIYTAGKRRIIGFFNTVDEAAAAYSAAAHETFGEFARAG